MRRVFAMIRIVIRSLALTLALGALFTHPAAAQNAVPALRASVTVTGDVVRIGDLIDNAGPVADVPIFRAPDLGTRGTVPAERVVEAIRPHQLIGIDTRGVSEVVVIRATRAIPAAEISARIAKALEGQFGLGAARDILVEFDREPHALNVEPSVTGELQVVSLAYNARNARFDVTLDLQSSAALRWQPTRFSGTAIETVNAVSVDHPVERGEILKASDLVMTRRPKAEGPLIGDMRAAAGLAARRQLRPGQPLHEADLMKPSIVQRNDTVTIIYEAPGISLTLRGQAQDGGALGDTISVVNSQSKRVVQGVITGPDRVSVTAVLTHFVENAPAPAAPAASEQAPQHEQSVE
jgi:flagellar basal body P-ring formation protein FlgA